MTSQLRASDVTMENYKQESFFDLFIICGITFNFFIRIYINI